MTRRSLNRPLGQSRRRSLSTVEVARFLRRLSTVYRDNKTGNPALSDALEELEVALNRHPNISLGEAVAKLEAMEYDRRYDVPNAEQIKNLGDEEIRGILSDDRITKAELVRLGSERFGISRARLARMARPEIVEVIWSALRHEDSLRIISQEARRGGTTRSS